MSPIAPETIPSETHIRASLVEPEYRRCFIQVTVLFFLWGLSNNLTDILVQQFRKSFILSQVEAQLVQTAVFFGYFCMALPAALLMRRWGYKAGILTGLLLFGSGMLAFWPAAIVGKYPLFLASLFIVGCGSATLETAANPFIAQLGASETSERRLNFAQAFNPPGTITGVFIGTFFIFSGVELNATGVIKLQRAGAYSSYLHSEIMRVVPTYVALGCIVLVWALVIGLSRFPVLPSEDVHVDKGSLREVLHIPHLWIAIIAQFCYVGAQVTTWSAFIPYMKQYTAATEREAALFLTGNLVALAIGRFGSTALMSRFRPSFMTGVYAVINIVLLGVAIFHPGPLGVVAILLTSFFMSIMFPTIFALGVKGLGANTKLGGSLIVMSIVGGAIFPPILGSIAKSTGSLALGYSVAAGAYIVVAMYGFWAANKETSIL